MKNYDCIPLSSSSVHLNLRFVASVGVAPIPRRPIPLFLDSHSSRDYTAATALTDEWIIFLVNWAPDRRQESILGRRDVLD
jgi:hypothetical protein